MRHGWIAGVAGLALVLAAAGAHAACDGDGPPSPSGFAGPLGKRFDALHAQDQEVDPGGKAKLWQALIDDIQRDPTAPPGLLVRSYAGLSWAQGSSDAEPSVSLASARKGLEIAVKAGLAQSAEVVEDLDILAIAEASVGELTAAEAHAAEARALARKHFGETSVEYAGALVAQAFLDYSNGRFLQAVDDYGQTAAIEQRCLPASSSRTVSHMASHAAVMDAAGLQEAALAENERTAAWAMAHLPPESTSINLSLNNLGVSLRNVNRLAEAEAVLREVLDRQARYETNVWTNRATTLSNFATLIDQQGRHEEAERLWLQSLDWRKRAGSSSDPQNEAQTLRFAADAAEARGDDATALARREQVVKILADAKTAETHPEMARARVSLAYSLALAGRKAEAGRMAQPAIATIRDKIDAGSIRRMGAEMTYAETVGITEGPQAGLAAAEPTARALEAKLLDTATSKADLIRYGAVTTASFGMVADYALQSGREDEAFHALQMANLSDIVVAGAEVATRAAARDPQARALVQALQDKVRERQLLDRQKSFFTSSGRQADASRAQGEIEAADREIARLGGELDRVFPDYRRLSRPAPVSLAEVRARLQPGQVLLAPVTLRDGVLAVAVTRDGLVWGKSNVGRPEVARLVARVRSSVDAFQRDAAAPFDVAAAAELYKAVAPPAVAGALKANPSLLYYAGGGLGAVPAALLVEAAPTGKAAPAWLIRTHDVTVATTLDLAPPAAGPTRSARFLGVGAPVLGKPQRLASRGAGALRFRDGRVVTGSLADLPALPGAAAELARLHAALGGRDDRLLIGAAASEATLKTMPLEDYGLITFATHGLGAGDLTGLSEPALVLTPPKTPTAADDGLLTASEIAGLRLDADWVVLSACDTAAGAEAGAASYSGLASAFRQAGARALLVSHWPVRDDAAKALTIGAVRNYRGGASRAKALQQAILTLMADARTPGAANPALWAPFVLVD